MSQSVDSFVQVATDGPGKKVRNLLLTQTLQSDGTYADTYSQVVNIVGKDGQQLDLENRRAGETLADILAELRTQGVRASQLPQTRSRKIYGPLGYVPITFSGLATASYQQSGAIVNSEGYRDYLLQMQIASAAAGTTATGFVQVAIAASNDGGISFSNGAVGMNQPFTPTSAANLIVPYTMMVTANSTTYVSGLFSIASFFGGVMPQQWSVILFNSTGATLPSVAAHEIQYQGVCDLWTPV